MVMPAWYLPYIIWGIIIARTREQERITSSECVTPDCHGCEGICGAHVLPGSDEDRPQTITFNKFTCVTMDNASSLSRPWLCMQNTEVY